MSRHTVADWRRAVFLDPHISDPTRVLLLLLADYMGADLKVSVKRSELAKRLGRSERRVADRFREAAGEMPGQDPSMRLLDRVVRGQKYVQAVYQGLVPNAFTMTPGGHEETGSQHDAVKHAENAGNRHGETAESGSQQDTRGSRLIRADLPVSPQHRDVGNDEETEDQPVRSDLTACDCHGASDCASLDNPHTREASA